jgi:hypothetical protein
MDVFPKMDMEWKDGERVRRGQVISMGDGDITVRTVDGREVTFKDVTLLDEQIDYGKLSEISIETRQFVYNAVNEEKVIRNDAIEQERYSRGFFYGKI